MASRKPLHQLDLAGVVGVVKDHPGDQVRVSRLPFPTRVIVQPGRVEPSKRFEKLLVAISQETPVLCPGFGRRSRGGVGPVRR